MPISMTYKHVWKEHEDKTKKDSKIKTNTDNVQCQVYKFSNPDGCGSAALCYFADTSALKYEVECKDKSSGNYYELKTVTEHWQVLNVNALTPA